LPPHQRSAETMKLTFKICLWAVALFFLGQIVVGALLGAIFFMWAMVAQFAETFGWFPVVASSIIVVPPALLYIFRGRILPLRLKG
jgi:hypothetical protein